MSIERPPAVPREWCPDCGEEMLFSGTQSAGYAQFFCEHCRYRRDTFVGVATVEEAQADGSETGGSESGAD
ncbi:HVO_2142 family zinc finger protein [Halopelagius longus]|uniref:Small CPxCG-related zinc finger protein n=1 Tax=Halopelagius longus TaxID=1236180 RepID=A0A1H0XN47_9EURY|nr:HVO_2142 family zinc finger protein [Halopelagius longus]RDI71942.1 hypothetical protein DWB78_09530 [Halopelagius longus]SDQ04314.1 hypothetical protein SAMN05216278_0010 [Halopelagius longus]